jgi:hypothetical protein
MALEKINITPLDKDGRPVGTRAFSVLFNPTTYSISKSVTWTGSPTRELNAPPLTFGGGGSRQLTLNLFYDVTESSAIGKRVKDVREETNNMVVLTRIERGLGSSKSGRPPAVMVSWGGAPPANSDFPFIGVVSQLSQTFKLFTSEGIPVRAELSVTFTEYKDPEKDKRETDPELTTRLVKRGDTVSSIAAEVYGDPARWRSIAEANGMDDPRRLDIGRRLSIPSIH